MSYGVQVWREGQWTPAGGVGFVTLTHAAEILAELDQEQVPMPMPRRVIRDDGEVVFAGRHCARDTPMNDTKPFWIVMSLDKPGPCERDGRPYQRHESKASALMEARRLSAACAGGRFGVLALEHVTGWIDAEIDYDDRIPF